MSELDPTSITDPMNASQTPDEPKGTSENEKPDPDPAREELVKQWTNRVLDSKKYFEKPFKTMKNCQDWAFYGGEKSWVLGASEQFGGKYRCNLTLRHLSQKTSQLYAKNPQAIAKHRDRLQYQFWDGKIESYMAAKQAVMQAQQAMAAYQASGGMMPAPVGPVAMPNAGPMPGPMPPHAPPQGGQPPGPHPMMPQPVRMVPAPPPPPVDPMAQMIVQDAEQGMAQSQMLDRVGRGLEILFHYFLEENNFKVRAKQLIRSTLVDGVGYVKLGFQRELEKRPEIIDQINDITARLAQIQRLQEEVKEGDVVDTDGEFEQLKLAMEQLTREQQVVVREGLVFDFPKGTQIIPSKETKHIRGWIGTDWIAHEFVLTTERIEEIYGVDVGTKFTTYNDRDEVVNPHNIDKPGEASDTALVWEIWSKKDGLVFTICQGYPDFLKEPEAPLVKLSRFYPFFSLTFNDVETDDQIFPPSDVSLLIPMQEDYNATREALKEQRRHSRPAYIAAAGAIDDEDLKRIANHVPNEVVSVNMPEGCTDVNAVVGLMKKAGVDPNLYETASIMDDIFRVVGSQEAVMGAASGGNTTATESSIAETNRVSAIASNVDDLDDFLSDLAQASSQVMLTEISADQVQKIVGPGAIWPTLTAQELADQIYLEIKAGSSGRPNRAQELSNFQMVLPYLMQLPGIQPVWITEQLTKLIDIGVDLSEAFVQGAPSIQAMNQQAAALFNNAGAGPGGPMGMPGQGGPMGMGAPPNGGMAGPGGMGGPGIRPQGAPMLPGQGNHFADPAAQGGFGANNGPVPQGVPGSGPGFPAPNAGRYPQTAAAILNGLA